jgi:hypothetical protein
MYELPDSAHLATPAMPSTRPIWPDREEFPSTSYAANVRTIEWAPASMTVSL